MAAAFLLMASALLPVPLRSGELVEIRLVIGGERLPLLLEDSAASRDFLEMLPLRVTLRDYNGTEKIGDLPGRLSTQGAPAGYEPAAGDVALYAPWGNIALFYRDFPWSAGLVRLGRLPVRRGKAGGACPASSQPSLNGRNEGKEKKGAGPRRQARCHTLSTH